MHHEHGPGHIAENMTRQAAEQVFPEPDVAHGAHHQDIWIVLSAVVNNRRAGGAAILVDGDVGRKSGDLPGADCPLINRDR
jgi:hypothetical protein